MSKSIATTSITDLDTFYIFRPDGHEVKVEAKYKGTFESSHQLTDDEKKEIEKLTRNDIAVNIFDRDDLSNSEKIKHIYKDNPNFSASLICEKLNVSFDTVYTHKNKL